MMMMLLIGNSLIATNDNGGDVEIKELTELEFENTESDEQNEEDDDSSPYLLLSSSTVLHPSFHEKKEMKDTKLLKQFLEMPTSPPLQ